MPFVTAFLIKSFEEGEMIYYKEVYVYDIDGFPMIPLVLVDDSAVPITDFYYHWYFYSEDKDFLAGREYKLKIKHGWGEASGKVFVPSDFQIRKPEPNYTLTKDSDLYCVWQRAAKADWYYFTLDLYYNYVDTNGQEKQFNLISDSITSDTVLSYDKNFLFPQNVSRIISGRGTINIWASDGSTVMPKAKENIRGDGSGFYNGINHSGERYFRIGPASADLTSSTKSAKERLLKRLRRGYTIR